MDPGTYVEITLRELTYISTIYLFATPYNDILGH